MATTPAVQCPAQDDRNPNHDQPASFDHESAPDPPKFSSSESGGPEKVEEDGVPGGDEDSEKNWRQEAAREVLDAAEIAGAKAAMAVEPVRNPVRSCLDRTAGRYPRSYNLFFRVVVPLFGLIGLSFLGGWALAELESGTEMETNDQKVRFVVETAVYVSALFMKGVIMEVEGEDNPCLIGPEMDLDRGNGTKMLQQLKECGDVFLLGEETASPLSFDWIHCGEEGVDWGAQSKHVISSFVTSYISHIPWKELYNAPSLDEFLDAHEEALMSASGIVDCRIHTAGGALFWFTVMTTVGYGNTAPVTDEGRALVYTLGFVSILCFTAVISQAGTICLAVFDDFAHRIRAPSLTRGILAALFWLAMLGLWLLIFSGIGIGMAKERQEQNLRDTFWFVFISITTVGLGDYHIPHETFKWWEMLVIPFLFLLGFVLVANFLHKFSAALATSMLLHEERSLEEILEERRKKER